MKKSALLVSALSLAFAAASAQAAPVTYDFTFSSGGGVGGSDTVVDGRITLEGSLLAQGDYNWHEYYPGGPELLALSVNISGGSAYDGHYGMNDFYAFAWNTAGGTLDLSRPLFGQDIGYGRHWGPIGYPSYGDFNLLGFRPEFTGAGEFRFVVDPHGLMLTRLDLVPSVPEPETYAMMLGGLGLLALAARRKKVSA
jgi:hypothetical protein